MADTTPPRTNYEHGVAKGHEDGMRAVRVLLEKLQAAKNDAAEWKEQHENLLAMFRASEERAAKAEAALKAAVPAGWCAVPIVPTQAMLDAGNAADYAASTHRTAGLVWEAMLRATSTTTKDRR